MSPFMFLFLMYLIRRIVLIHHSISVSIYPHLYVSVLIVVIGVVAECYLLL